MMAGLSRRWQPATSATKTRCHPIQGDIDMATWWEYYKLKKEPLLSPNPLTRTEDQTLFFGRESDQ
jgi:hypothetical protein